MGFQVQDYPNPLLAAVKCNAQSLKAFEIRLKQAYNNNCDALIAPIFSDQYIKQEKKNSFELDRCFIISDSHYPKDKLNLICPLINDCVWSLLSQKRKAFLELFFGYLGYLDIKYFSIALKPQMFQLFLEAICEVRGSLQKCRARMIMIIQTKGESSEQNQQKNDQIWKNYIGVRQKLRGIKFPVPIELALHFKSNLPCERIINRWKSQKIYYMIMSQDCFVSNQKGYSVLPARHERITLDLLFLKAMFVYQVDEEFFEDIEKNQCFEYIFHIYKKMCASKNKNAKKAIALIDYLQNPLQPYADNLESETYQIFQSDTPKYSEYQHAMEEALETLPKNRKLIAYYIGSGRGQLLYSIYQAAKKTGRDVFVYAIEKNPYPIQTIKKRIRENKWENKIKIVHTDIKDYEMEEKPDLFFSELLGGFGDNELSPECLYWAEKYLIILYRNITPETLCIPQNYISYIKPISYQEIHRQIEKNMRHCYYTTNYGSFFVDFFASQEAWRFQHPFKPRTIEQFNKHSSNVFTASHDIMINGFAGYFTTKLFGNAELSILPERPTFDSYSWFPIFFPFEEPVYLEKGQEIKIEMWRINNGAKIWYEWKYTTNGKESISHNKDGHLIAIELL